MKLLSAAAAASTNNSTVSGATAVYVVTSGAFTLSVVDSDGTAGGTNGTVLGTVELPSGWSGVIHKNFDQYLKGGDTAAKFTKIDAGSR
jgi:hypothetical protein